MRLMKMFDVPTGKSLRYSRLAYKLKQIQFSLASTKFIVLNDEMKINCASIVNVYSLSDFLSFKTEGDDNRIAQQSMKPTLSFPTIIEPATNRTTTKVMWYLDDESFFASTNQGEIIRYSPAGKFITKALIHPQTPINSFTFSKDFSILATAANDGCKVIDPQTFEIIRYFKQQLPMNTISISPLFCSSSNPKHHLIMGGGIASMMAAMTRGKGGFQATLCNVMYANEVGRVPGHFGPINSIQFFKDGLGYISAGEDSYVRVVRFDESYLESSQ